MGKKVLSPKIAKDVDELNGKIMNLGPITSSTLTDFLKSVLVTFVAKNITDTPCLIYATWSGHARYLFNAVNVSNSTVTYEYATHSDVGSGLYTVSSDTLTINSLNSKITDYVTIASSGNIVIGAMSAGTTNYGTFTVTVPNGYKTNGILNVAHSHPGNGYGFYVQAGIDANKTGVVTGYYVYGAIASVIANSSDFTIFVECVKS